MAALTTPSETHTGTARVGHPTDSYAANLMDLCTALNRTSNDTKLQALCHALCDFENATREAEAVTEAEGSSSKEGQQQQRREILAVARATVTTLLLVAEDKVIDGITTSKSNTIDNLTKSITKLETSSSSPFRLSLWSSAPESPESRLRAVSDAIKSLKRDLAKYHVTVRPDAWDMLSEETGAVVAGTKSPTSCVDYLITQLRVPIKCRPGLLFFVRSSSPHKIEHVIILHDAENCPIPKAMAANRAKKLVSGLKREIIDKAGLSEAGWTFEWHFVLPDLDDENICHPTKQMRDQLRILESSFTYHCAPAKVGGKALLSGTRCNVPSSEINVRTAAANWWGMRHTFWFRDNVVYCLAWLGGQGDSRSHPVNILRVSGQVGRRHVPWTRGIPLRQSVRRLRLCNEHAAPQGRRLQDNDFPWLDSRGEGWS